MTRLCDIKYCVYDNLEVYRTHTSDYCVRKVLLRISLQVYSVKILGRNKTSKYYVTFDGGELYKLKFLIDRGSIYNHLICPCRQIKTTDCDNIFWV